MPLSYVLGLIAGFATLARLVRKSAPLRRLLSLKLLRRSGVTKTVFRAHEAYQARRSGDAVQAGGSPLPPPRMRVLVGGTADVDWFLTVGREIAEIISECVSESARSIDEMEAVLDFGCGCGRVLRHMPELTDAQIFGSDYNPELVGWVRDCLPLATVAENARQPPLAFDESMFDLVYAISVFTHLTEDLQHRWVSELARVVKPGGLLIFTTHGERFVDRLGRTERERFRDGKMVVQFDEMEGSNWCAAFHPEEYVSRRLLGSSFVLRGFRPGAPDGVLQQDCWTAEKTAL